MKLSAPLLRASDEVKERIRLVLSDQCQCCAETATLKRRRIKAYVTVHLQCDGCGRSLSGALPRAQFVFWQDFPEWDEALVQAYQEKCEADRQERLNKLQPLPDIAHRREEYAEWCRTSPDWKIAKERVMWRSRGICEACLLENATIVHHVTYSSGKLPPAWYLRAVCAECHTRLHNGDDEWCEFGMARNDQD